VNSAAAIVRISLAVGLGLVFGFIFWGFGGGKIVAGFGFGWPFGWFCGGAIVVRKALLERVPTRDRAVGMRRCRVSVEGFLWYPVWCFFDALSRVGTRSYRGNGCFFVSTPFPR